MNKLEAVNFMSPEKNTIRISAAVIRDAAGRLLLVRKRGTSAFMQPGGKIEPRELPTDALARELQEELGIAIDPTKSSYLGSFSAPAANEPNCIVKAEIFILSTAAEPKPAAEIEEILWLAPEMIHDIELASLTKDIVLPLCGFGHRVNREYAP